MPKRHPRAAKWMAFLPLSWSRLTAILQGTYYAVTGAWPLVSLPTFVWVTGPKADTWLVQTVGVLVLVVGTTLLVGARRKQILPETRLLGVLGSLAFVGIDVAFYLQGRIGAIYLGDAAAELAIAMAWLATLREKTPQPPSVIDEKAGP